jgi:aminopeptidase N
LKPNFVNILTFVLILLPTLSWSQEPAFTRQDTLRGSITQERAWWDLTYYHLDVNVHPKDSSLQGINTVQFKVLTDHDVMQLDLQPPMHIDKVTQNGKDLSFKKDGNAWFIQFPEKQKTGSLEEVQVFFSGQPKVSTRPPWDGGLTWKKGKNGTDIVTTTCQGDGASLWWPCKDHMYDEPDSVLISVTVPKGLMDVSNGRLRGIDEHKDGRKTFHWFVNNPISNYVINLNIADYVHFSEKYKGEKGVLDCDYYVYPENLEKAKKQFKDATRMLEAFEYWFGPYPFYEDGYKLVEVPYPGMEHQSSVTYGNGYANGFGGKDLSNTGQGFKFDFIIIHESGHEWFANSITYKDVADMWIHEGFTAYSENLFLDYHYGKEASAEYVIGTRENIQNDRPIIGIYDVNYEGSSDMYYKGANMLHTLRQIVDNDKKWRQMLRGLNEMYYHKIVTTAQIEGYLSEQVGHNMEPFFTQYLRDIRIPIFEYFFRDGKLMYRWSNCIPTFDMPLKITLDGKMIWLEPRTFWSEMPVEGEKQHVVNVDRNFYVAVFDLKKR